MNRRRWLGGWLGALGLLALPATGCVPPRDSKVSKGELVEVGEPGYDALFTKLRDAVAKTSELDGEAPLRKAVASAMGLADDAGRDATIEALSEKSKELKAKGVPISVALSPEPKVGGKVEWAGAIEKALREGLKRADDLAALSKTIADLEPLRAEALADADKKLKAAGIPVAKIREAKAELTAAEEVLKERRLQASNESGRAARYTLSVAQAVDLTAGSSSPAAPPPPPPAETGKKVPPWARKPPAGGRPPSGAPPAKPPPAKPPPKKPQGDDFDL
jgi:hypothetical protein